jgi:uncharacterized protein YkwD
MNDHEHIEDQNTHFWLRATNLVLVLACLFLLFKWRQTAQRIPPTPEQAAAQAEDKATALLYHAYVLELYGRYAQAQGERQEDAVATRLGDAMVALANQTRAQYASNMLKSARVSVSAIRHYSRPAGTNE